MATYAMPTALVWTILAQRRDYSMAPAPPKPFAARAQSAGTARAMPRARIWAHGLDLAVRALKSLFTQAHVGYSKARRRCRDVGDRTRVR